MTLTIFWKSRNHSDFAAVSSYSEHYCNLYD